MASNEIILLKKDANNNLIYDLSAPGSSREDNKKVTQSDLDPNFNEGVIQFIDERIKMNQTASLI